MYLKRKIDAFLADWKSNPKRHPLIVKGARQVGKTESILHFAKANYASVIAINFIRQPHYKHIADNGYGAEEIIKEISRVDPTWKFIPGKTLLFFDEIQEYPELTTALKFFSIDKRFDVICSGSLLGVHYRRISSISVGYQSVYEMRSMDFEEFLWATGYPDTVANDLLDNMLKVKPFSASELHLWENRFLDYIMLGGMPAVLSLFVANNHFAGTADLQQDILDSYRADIRKYAESLDATKILSVFNHVPLQLAKENKKFQLSKINPRARTREYGGCIQWLLDAGVISACHCLRFPELPLKGNYLEDKFKIYVSDTGILIAMLDEEARNDLRANRNLGVYKGALYENFVAEALSKSGYELFYYRREDGSMEQDFFVRDAKHLIPVEIKAGNNTAKSMRTLISSDQYPDIAWGIKLIHGNIGKTESITTFPYFCTFLLKRYLKMQDESRFSEKSVK